jgi:hypothetical protein
MTTTSEPPVPAPPPPEPVDVPVQESPTPYRSVPTSTDIAEMAPTSRLTTLWAPALSVSAVVLWSFVVMGQLVTTFAPGRHDMLVGEGMGALFVVGTSTTAWVRALRQSLHTAPVTGLSKRMERGLALGVLAFLGWALAMAVAIVIGNAIGNADGVVTLLLLALAGASYFYARRLLRAERPVARGVMTTVLWVSAGVITLAALVALAASD